ncbi:hypothetical protein [Streptomyces sp. NPDC018000]|uniref:hypothetical protein n=1 Tax=Streptomyces sp. NPDC018000 TaxID=3365028 RepID=UPI0037A9374C
MFRPGAGDAREPGADRGAVSFRAAGEGEGPPQGRPVDRPLTGPLREQAGELLDGAALSARSRRELAHVHYVFDHNR